MSRRTDGGPADKKALTGGGAYGESKDLAQLQSGAPMQSPGGGPAAPEAPVPSPFVGLFDQESGRADEPVTFGADAGEGPGSEVLGLDQEDLGDIQYVLPYLPALQAMADSGRGSPTTRAFIRRIRSRI
jgi:hypothetical protein